MPRRWTSVALTLRALFRVRHLGASRLEPYRRAIPVLFHLRSHLALTALLSHPRIAPQVERRTRLLYKYIWPYLMRRLGRAERLSALMCHYRFLVERAPSGVLRCLTDGPCEVWWQQAHSTRYSMAVGLSRLPDVEGEMEVSFRADDVSIFHLSCSIVPGDLARVPEREVLLIGGVQGAPRQLSAIRLATRACGDIALAKLLVAAASALALELGLSCLVGVGTAEHVSRGFDPTAMFPFDYDAFWESMRATAHDGLFVLRLPDTSPLTHRVRAALTLFGSSVDRRKHAERHSCPNVL